MTPFEHALLREIYNATEIVIPASETRKVDLRGSSGFVCYFASGAPTAQAADGDGVVLTGSSATSPTTQVPNDRLSHFVNITAGTAPVTVCVLR